ncbi:MAG TPA: hypothetical protein VNM48_20685, partial [Chloroflexota bacterium]|nr:hypothetical protein [Chloroflexota bacterium]
VKRNSITDGWVYPIMDDVPVEEASTAFHTQQSLASAPILAFTGASRWSAPVTFPKMLGGTLFVGGLTQEATTWSLGSIGTPVTSTGAAPLYAVGIYYHNGNYIAHVEGATLSIPQDSVAGFGYLTMFAFNWAENGRAYLYSMSRNGFQAHGSVAVPAMVGMAQRRIWAGTRADGVSVNGYVMLGAPRFGASFLTHRIVPVAETRIALEAWYSHVARFATFTVPPPPYGLELTISDVPDAVSGRTVNVPVTLTKEGGFTGDIEWVVQSSNASLRVGEPFQEGDDTAQDWLIPVTAEEGIPAGDYTVTVTVRAVGQTTSELLKDVIDTKTFGITVRLGDPALVIGTTRFNALGAWQDKSHTTLWANGVTGQTGGVLVRKGLARQTSRWDGAYGDGTNFSQWGGAARVTSVDYVANMAADHYLQFAIPDAATWATGAVFLTISSQANKFQYWQVYKAADGIKVRTSTGTTSATQAESGNSLPFVTGIMDLAVTVTGGTVRLINPKTEATVTTPAVTWAGAGKLTLFAAELSDGTVQGLSKACVLSIASGPVIPSIFQMERQAEYFRGFMLRASTYDRAEYPDATYAIFLADVGNVLRNYHPATSGQTMISKGTGATTSSGSFLTTGAAETGWRTGYITGSSGAQANDVIWTMRNLNATGG